MKSLFHNNLAGVFLIAAILTPFCAFSQISLDLKIDKQRYLRYEPIAVSLTVTNFSGNTLEFGGKTPDTQGRIDFQITSASGRNPKLMNKLSNPANGLTLAPGESRTLQIYLNQYYDMQREDSYSVTAFLNHGRLPRTHTSKQIRVEVQDGLPILSKSIGLPTERKKGLIKAIQISLLRFADTDEDIYAMRAEDDVNVYSVFRLGSFIDGEKPQMELDDNSLIHVLLQIRPRLYVYYIFGFEERNLRMRQKRFYVSADGAPPSLNKDSGYLRVVHGAIAREGIDYYEPKEEKAKTEEEVKSR
ncbi:MAG: hypothetical protein MJ106_06965 [Lentisphaeria bacterium]|nr:hypothetical protein [Lentisphaeria bacterium]